MLTLENRQVYDCIQIDGVWTPVARARKRVARLEAEVPPGAGRGEALNSLARRLAEELKPEPKIIDLAG